MSRSRDTANQINRVNSSAADATAITVDSSENVGIGVVPESSYPARPVLRIGSGLGLMCRASGNPSHTWINSNAYQDPSTADDKYIDTDQASQISQTNGNIHFMTAPSGSANTTISWTNAMSVMQTGGITFNGDTAADNALNDYEEGTFTPTVVFGSGSSGITYSVREGKYTKIGNTVQYYVKCSLSSKGSSTGNLSITGLPFTNTDTASPPSILTGAFTNTSDVQIYLNSGGATLNLENRNTGTQSPLSNSNVNNNSTMFIAGVYRTSQ